jgi:hypothetical protein
MTDPESELSLKDFPSYEAFEDFSRSLFELEPEEHEGLYRVLLKLESIGEDPMEKMLSWKEDTCEKDCRNFIRFMIQIDEMDLDAFQEAMTSNA